MWQASCPDELSPDIAHQSNPIITSREKLSQGGQCIAASQVKGLLPFISLQGRARKQALQPLHISFGDFWVFGGYLLITEVRDLEGGVGNRRKINGLLAHIASHG